MTTTLMQLCQTGAKRCVISPSTAQPPYIVSVFDGDILASSVLFETHDEAVTHAIAALREATPPTQTANTPSTS